MKDIVEIRKKQKEVLDRIRKRSTNIAYSKYNIVLLLDVSTSMFGEKVKDAKDALIYFLKSINPTENEVGLVAFGGEIQTCELSRDYINLETKIKSFDASGDTPLMNAIKAAYELLRKKVSLVMIIATDGQPNDAPEGEILEYATSIKKKGVSIITIGIGEDVDEDFLIKLASSYEDYHFAKESFELKKIYKEVADVLALPER